MLDVHPPHEPVHGWRDFLLHLLTITIGLLIALGLEGCVEWAHHRHLVHQAEENLNEEIRENQKELREALSSVPLTEKQIQANLEMLRLVRSGKPADIHSMTFAFTEPTLKEASWNTARETGALSYMPYQTVQSYSDLYTVQRLVQNMDLALIEADSHAIAAILIEGDPRKLTPAEAADALRSTVDIQARLLVIRDVARQLDASYSKHLQKGRD